MTEKKQTPKKKTVTKVTEVKAVTKKKVTGKKAPEKMTSREIILHYCKVEQIRGYKGEALTFGAHRYRMNKPFADFTDVECDKILKHLHEHLSMANHIKSVKKNAATLNKRRITVTTDPKPCECGCGEMTRRGSKFRPGHDMKLKSKLRKAAEKGNANAKAKAQNELKSRGWAK